MEKNNAPYRDANKEEAGVFLRRILNIQNRMTVLCGEFQKIRITGQRFDSTNSKEIASVIKNLVDEMLCDIELAEDRGADIESEPSDFVAAPMISTRAQPETEWERVGV